LEYILATKIGLIAGPISWKIGAAYAALNSVLAGVEDILLNTQSRSSITEETIKNISKEEIYKAYLKRKAELGIN
jgi:transcription initiation factor TFIIIB Brf1 subunit/transcription initiation factor TFIIB